MRERAIVLPLASSTILEATDLGALPTTELDMFAAACFCHSVARGDFLRLI